MRTPGVPPVVLTPRQAAFTKVPRFGGTTSWEQYRQVFDAIVLSNGWDDATTALQLLSHLEGDALNVAGGHQAEIHVGSNGRIAPTTASRCGYSGSCPSSGSGGSGGGEVVTASGGENTDLTACSGPVDKAVRWFAGVTCLSSGTGCKAGAMMPGAVGTLSPSVSDSVDPLAPSLMTLTALLAHMGRCIRLTLTLLALLARMGRCPHLTLTMLALLARMGCCPV